MEDNTVKVYTREDGIVEHIKEVKTDDQIEPYCDSEIWV